MIFDEEQEKPDEPTKPKNDTDVKGSYYPGDNNGNNLMYNVGGAITGDSTNLLLYLNFLLFSIGLIGYLIYRKQKDTFHK